MKISHKNYFIEDQELAAVVCSHNLDFTGNNLHLLLGSFRASALAYILKILLLWSIKIMVIPNRTE